jgi:hypothetical protein
MARTLSLLAALVLLAGCGESFPSTPAEQAVTHLRTGHYDQAIAACDEAIRLDAKDPDTYLTRGRAYQFRNDPGDLDRAIADFSESIRLAPQQIEAYYSRAIAYRDRGDDKRSLADNTKARENDQHLKQVYSHLPGTVPDLPEPAVEKAAEGSSSASAEAAQPIAGDELDESLRIRREITENELKDARGDGPSPGKARNSKRGAPDSQRFLPRSDDIGSDDGSVSQPLDAFDTPRKQPYNGPRNGSAPQGRQNAGRQPRGQATRESSRGMGSSRETDFDDPAAPGPSRGRISNQRRMLSPVQSPFPQLPPRPTGIVEQVAPLPGGPQTQPRQYFTNPYAPPTVHPPGAYQTDYNP